MRSISGCARLPAVPVPMCGFSRNIGLFKGRHLGEALEPCGLGGADTQQPWTKANRVERACFDLLVYLFATDHPVPGQPGYGDVRFGMNL